MKRTAARANARMRRDFHEIFSMTRLSAVNQDIMQPGMRGSVQTATLCSRMTREFLDCILESMAQRILGQDFRILDFEFDSDRIGALYHVKSNLNRFPYEPRANSN